MWMQKMLWDEVQDPNLISEPKAGRRVHIRGAAVDLTLVDKDGKELAMPTTYCEFAKHEQMKQSYQQLSAEILKNRKTLRDAMTSEGFQIYENEWWHYDLKNWSEFPIIESDQWIKPADKASSQSARKDISQ